MTTILICSHLSVGGAEVVIEKQCEILKDVLVICTDNFGAAGKRLKSKGVSILDVSADPDKNVSVENVITQIKPQIVYIHNALVPKAIEATRHLNYKLVIQVHGTLDFPELFAPRLIEKYKTWIDLIIVPHLRSFHIASAYAECKLILNPIRREFFSTVHNPSNIVGFCGRISPEKSLLSLARIMSILQKSVPDIETLIVGDADLSYKKCTDYKKSIQNEFEKFNIPLTIVGFVENPWKFMSLFRIGAVTSVVEGFCNFLWECSAMGIPCVSTNVGSASFIINPNCIVNHEYDGKSIELSESQCGEFANKMLFAMNNKIENRHISFDAHEDVYEDKFLSVINSLKR